MIEPSAAYTAPLLKSEVLFAGFWRRLLAFLIDLALLSGVYFAIYAGARVLMPDNFDVLANVVPVCAAIGWAYYAICESSPARGTLGKVALGLYVADAHGDPITFWRAARRYAFKALSTLIFGLGWLMAAFTPRKQALHDALAGTLVLRRVNYLVFGPQAPTEPGDFWDGARWVASVPPMERS
jgi:uncharacterized RDD family membrane protein YckC